MSVAAPVFHDNATFLAAQILAREKSNAVKTTTTQVSPGSVGLLIQRSHALNLGQPIWEIFVEPGTERTSQRFIGTLSIGHPPQVTVSIVEPDENSTGAGLSSKKEVKSVLAQKALKALEVYPKLPKVSASSVVKAGKDDNDGINWIGRVLEYTNSLPMEHRTLNYHESSIVTPNTGGPQLFSCSVELRFENLSMDAEVSLHPEYINQSFPSDGDPEIFASKKAARTHASRLAGQHLVSLGLLRPDGSLPPKIVTTTTPSSVASLGPSIAANIPQTCMGLGLPPPKYEFTSPSGDPNNAFVNCSAHFPRVHGLPDPIATATNVYGKKNAKEACARELSVVLEKVKAWRLKGGGQWQD